MEKNFHLTKNESEIMSLLWGEKSALASADIIRLSSVKSWKSSSIHILLNSLLDKGAIEVSGYTKTGKHYGRTFSPTLTREEYWLMQLTNGISERESRYEAIKSIFATLVADDDITATELEELQQILDQKRAQFPAAGDA